MRNLMAVVFMCVLCFSSSAWAQPECEKQCQPGKVIRVILPTDVAWQVIPLENNSVEIRVYFAKGKTNFLFKRLKLGSRVTVKRETVNNCALVVVKQKENKQVDRLSIVGAVKYFLMDAEEWPERDYEVLWLEGEDIPFVRLLNWSVGDDLLYPDKAWRLNGCPLEESLLPPMPPGLSVDVKKTDTERKCDCHRWQKQLRNQYFYLKGNAYNVLRPMLQDGFRFEFVSEGGMLLIE